MFDEEPVNAGVEAGGEAGGGEAGGEAAGEGAGAEGAGQGEEIEGQGEGGEGQPPEGAEGEAAAEGEGDEGGEGEGEGQGQGGEGEEGKEGAAAKKEPTPEEQSLAEAYRKYPKLKEFLKVNPEHRPLFFRAVEVGKIFSTPKEAQLAKEWAMEMANFDRLFYGDKAAKQQLLKSLYENSLQEGPGGEKVPSGHYDDFCGVVVETATNGIQRMLSGEQGAELAKAAGVTLEQAKAAVYYTMRLLGLGEKEDGGGERTPEAGRPASRGQTGLEREVNELREFKAGVEKEKGDSFIKGINTDFTKWLKDEVINPALAKATGLKSPLLRRAVESEIEAKIMKVMKDDDFFSVQVDKLAQSGKRGPEQAKQIMVLLETRARHVARESRIIQDVLAEAAGQVKQEQDARTGHREKAGSRKEPVSASSPGRVSGSRPEPMKQKEGETYQQYSARVLGTED